MLDAVIGLSGAAVGAGVAGLMVRQVLSGALQQAFEYQRLRFESDLKRALDAHSVELQIWASNQKELFAELLRARANAMDTLLQTASQLRRFVLALGEPRELTSIETLYRRYCDLYYSNPVMPGHVADAAHRFRAVAEEALGCCRVAGAQEDITLSVRRKLDAAYEELVTQVRSVLLPASK